MTPPATKNTSERLKFKTHALLKNLVGKDLINDDNIAIVELVKNSYDAQAKKVTLKFEDVEEDVRRNGRRIIIVDNGGGMDKSDIEDKWLNIAYSDKLTITRQSGAKFAGNKGVGRFSCDRLGSSLDMLTRKKNGDLYRLRINWLDFEQEGDKDRTIQKIKVRLNEVSAADVLKEFDVVMPQAGTVLVISKLRSEWGHDKLLGLKRSLEKFISPNQPFSREKFEVLIEAEHEKKDDEKAEYHDKVNGIVENVIFERLQFGATYIESKINGDEVDFVLYHGGKRVFKVTEKNTKYQRLDGVSIVVYFLNPYKKAYFKRQTGVRSVDFGSIFLFLNSFRIAPYGDRGDDWLGLDVRKTQGTTRYLSSRDVIGRIEVIGSEDHFKPISSREGLKLTPQFVTLKEDYFHDVFRKLERFVVDGLDWDSVPRSARREIAAKGGLNWEATEEQYFESWDKKSRRISKTIMALIGVSKSRIIKLWFNTSLLDSLVEERSQEVQAIIDDIEAFDGVSVDQDLKKNLKKIGKIVSKKDADSKQAKQQVVDLKVEVEGNREAIQTLRKKSDAYQDQVLFLKSVTSLDEKVLLSFHHQICNDSITIDNYIAKTMTALRDDGDIEKALGTIGKASKVNKKILATAQFATKANFKSGTRREVTDIPIFFEQYLNNVTKDFMASGLQLEVNNKVSEFFEVNAKRIELSILIDNIVSNASKAHANHLSVNMKLRDKHHLIVSFVDDGNGLDKSVRLSDVFDLGVTSTNGSGLGLFHSKEIMESLDGDIQFIPGKQKGVEIRVMFTR